ncbi:MAG: DUF5597 domain-containing protein [Lachnospiraceae bacterium]|nr:DUF5597 domain-containing protein [Lachnospiraceae bacterium]
MSDFVFRNGKGEAVFPVGLQAHNSSTGEALLGRAIEAVRAVGGNCLEAPVYWYLMEPEMDRYDFSHVKDLICRAREAGLYLIILWFGTSKNGHPNYVPEYIKLHPETYRPAYGCDGAPLEALSVHCGQTLERDRKAFCRLMAFLRDFDSEERTVLAVQVENEMGYGGTDRDYGEAGEKAYLAPVPEALDGIATEGSGLEEQETREGLSPWKRRFGRYAGEAFSAWYTARYIEAIAEAGKQVFELPMTVNVMVGENGFREAGLCYNAGAPVSRMLDIWKKAAPAIDVIGPDIYRENRSVYEEICHSYDREDNSLFVPESPVQGEANALNLILAAASGAIGLFCFGAEQLLDGEGNVSGDSREIAVTLKTVAAMAPLLLKYRKTGKIHAFAEEEFEPDRYVRIPPWHVVAHFSRYLRMNYGYSPAMEDGTLQTGQIRGRAILVQTGDDEFYFGGTGVALDFVRIPEAGDERGYAHMNSRACSQLNFLSVEEGHFEDGAWVCDFRRNGDETNFSQYVLNGQVIRIRLNPAAGRP